MPTAEMANIRHKYTNMQEQKYTNLQKYKSANIKIYKYANIHIYKYANIREALSQGAAQAGSTVSATLEKISTPEEHPTYHR